MPDATLETVLDESRFQWSAGPSPRSASCSGTRVVAEVVDEAVVFRTRVLRLGAKRPASVTDALTDVMAALNASCRFVRVGIAGRNVTLAAVVPRAALDGSAVNRAVEAIAACTPIARGACAALTSEQVANWYLAFHKSHIAHHTSTGGDRLWKR